METTTLQKWGYAKQKFNKDELILHFRPGTSDETIIKEVLQRNVYQKKKIGFLIEPTDVWLDCGGNVGCFSLLVLSAGGTSVIVEPEPENLKMIEQNLEANFPNQKGESYDIIPGAVDIEEKVKKFYLCRTDYNKSRHTLYEKKGWKHIEVQCHTLKSILETYPEINAIKMDIEGSEIDILEHYDFSNFQKIQKLVFEYSFDVDRSIPRFLNIVKRLEKCFKVVNFTKIDPNDSDKKTYDFYPPQTLVFCLR